MTHKYIFLIHIDKSNIISELTSELFTRQFDLWHCKMKESII